MVVVRDRRAVVADDHVALGEARASGRAPRVDPPHDGAATARRAERAGQLLGERLDRDAEPSPRDPAALDELRDDALDHVDRDREADALAARDDRRVDADDLAAQVHEGAARVAGVDRRVGLDEVLVGGDADVGAAGRADDPDRHRLVEAERVADGDRPLAHPERVGVPERRDREIALRLEPDDGEVGLRVGADDAARVLSLRSEADGDAVGSLDDVEVGEDVAALVDDHAGAEARQAELAARAGSSAPEESLEEFPEGRIVGEEAGVLGPGASGDLYGAPQRIARRTP